MKVAFMAQWYVRRCGKVLGPVRWIEIEEAARQGKLAYTDELCEAGSTTWRIAQSLSELGDFLGPTPERPEISTTVTKPFSLGVVDDTPSSAFSTTLSSCRPAVDPAWRSVEDTNNPFASPRACELQAPLAEVAETTRSSPADLVPATLFQRVAALSVDWIVVCIVMSAGMFASLATHPHRPVRGEDTILHGWLTFDQLEGLLLLGAAIFLDVFLLRTKYKTPGKLLLGIDVVTQSGQPLTLARAALRLTFKMILLPGIFYHLGSFALSPRRRVLHDHLSGTLVIQSVRRPSSFLRPSNPVDKQT